MMIVDLQDYYQPLFIFFHII